jgi:dihydropteroate synthase
MQINVEYADPVSEIIDYLVKRTAAASAAGIRRENIIIDPGLGFGKRLADNVEILQRLNEFKALSFPLLLGASRKSFIGSLLASPAEPRAPEGRLVGTAADILRVHDVGEAADLVKIFRALYPSEFIREAAGGSA